MAGMIGPFCLCSPQLRDLHCHGCSNNAICGLSQERRPGEGGSEVLTPHVHGVPVQLGMLHHSAALHILHTRNSPLSLMLTPQLMICVSLDVLCAKMLSLCVLASLRIPHVATCFLP